MSWNPRLWPGLRQPARRLPVRKARPSIEELESRWLLDGISLATGFAGSAGLFTFNGQGGNAAHLDGSNLAVIDGHANEANSAFYNAPQSVTGFHTEFHFQSFSAAADGMTFTIQGVGATALGAGGGGLGYASIARSLAVKFDLYDNQGEGYNSVGFFVNGQAPTVGNSFDVGFSNLNIHGADPLDAAIDYDGTKLVLKLTDHVTAASGTWSFNVDIPTLVGGDRAWVGFTGGTGGFTATMDVLDWTFTPNVTAAPAAPTNLSAAATSGTQVNLAWTDNDPLATGYKIERKTGVNGIYAQIAQVGNLASSFQDTGLANGTQYFYRVRATGQGGDSPYSNEVSATTLAPPADPSSGHSTFVGAREIDLAWTDNATTETAYQIYRGVNGGAFMLLTTLAADSMAYNDTGLTPGTAYDYRVIATNAIGSSGFTGVQATTIGPPAAPTGAQATLVTGTEVDLAWTDNAVNETGYQVFRSVAGGAFTLLASLPANSTTLVDTSLSFGTAYEYHILATNSAGTSAFADVAATTLAPPADPTGGHTTRVSGTEIDLAWTDNASTETSYQVWRSVGAGSLTLLATLPANSIGYADTGLAFGTAYDYHVLAANAVGNSNFIDIAATTLAPPADPSNGHTTLVSGTEIDLAWTDNASTETGYQVWRSVNGSALTLLASLAANTTSYTDTGLAFGTAYDYHVLASNAVGNSNFVDVSATTLAPPADPTNGHTTLVSGTEIDLAWTDQATTATGYQVFRSTAGGAFQLVATLAAHSSSYADTGLAFGTAYDYHVLAFNAVGSSNSVDIAATTLAPPADPTGGHTTLVSGTEIDLAWTDNATTETGYQVWRSVGGGTFNLLATLAADSSGYTDTGLTFGTTYDYHVLAFNAVGDSNVVDIAATTLAPPADPSNGHTTLVSGTEIDLAWADNATTETGYQVWRSVNGGASTLLASLAANATSYADTGLAFGTAYDYHVLAANAVGNSNFVDIGATTLAPPADPTNGHTTLVSGTEIDLAWTDNATTETGYQVFRSTAGGSFQLIASLLPNSTGFADTGLAFGTGYDYHVLATNAVGDSNFVDIAATTLAPPADPTNGHTTLVTGTEIDLAWTDNATTGTGYAVYRSTAGGAFQLVATLAANSSSYADTGLAFGMAYDYHVLAFNAVGSSNSVDIAATTLAPPADPTSGHTTLVSGTEIDLAWTDNASTETSYQVWRSVGAGSLTLLATLPANSIGYADTGLAFGTAYDYHVLAANAVGNSNFIDIAATTLAPPADPSNGHTTLVSGTEIDLAWTDNASTETGYQVWRSVNGGASTLLASLAANATSYADTGLAFGTAYDYHVLASNAVGNSNFADVSATTLAPPADPTNGHTTLVTGTEIDLAWTDNATTATGYQVFRSTAGGAFQLVATLAANSSSYADTGLAFGTQYAYHVFAFNSVGNSNGVDIAATTLAPPADPTSGYTTLVSGTEVDLAWTDNASTETGYQVFRSTAGGAFQLVATLAADSSHYADTGLSVGTAYDYHVLAFNAVGNSNVVDIAATTIAPPAAPTDGRPTLQLSSEIDLAWTDNASNETGYEVYRALAGTGSYQLLATLAANSTSYADTGLAASTGFDYRLDALNVAGRSAFDAFSASTTAVSVPAPTNLAAQASDGQVTLTWSASAGATSYTIWRGTVSGGEGTTPLVTGLTGTTFTDQQVVDGTTYFYQVSAATTFGPSARSNEASATPLFAAHINFTSDGKSVPTGYVNDLGDVYGARASGLVFGWSQNNRPNARDRDSNLSPDELHDTFAAMQRPNNPNAVWEIAVPNGTYQVHLIAGDPTATDSIYKINVEGVLALSGVPNQSQHWFENTVVVTVTDGRLTLSNAAGSVNNKIDAIDICQVAGAAAAPAAPAAQPTGVAFGNGFGGAMGLHLNGSARIANGVLRLTDARKNEAGSVFTQSKLDIRAFTTQFDFQLLTPRADGFTFTLQGVSSDALGMAGGGLGYGANHVGGLGGIANSVAIKFDLYNNQGEGANSTGLYVNGAAPTGAAITLSGTGINLHSGHHFRVAMSYNGKVLTVTITDLRTRAVARQSYTIDLASTLGGTGAYVGFTGGTGAQAATQDVLNWTFRSGN